MAYAAVITLKHTIQRLLSSSRISFVSGSRRVLEVTYMHMQSLQEVLEGLKQSTSNSRKWTKALEEEMREKVWKFEDVLESCVSNQFLSQSESLGDEGCSLKLSLDLRELSPDTYGFPEMVKSMKRFAYAENLYISLSEEDEDDDDDDADVSSSVDFAGNKSEMVGLADEFGEIRHLLLNARDFLCISIVGMPGIGKTKLVKRIFEDPLILTKFECRAFVRVGQKSHFRKVLQAILAQVNPNIRKLMLMQDNEKLYEHLRKSLKGRKYLIVLDDVWDTDSWALFRSILARKDYGCAILVTTRLKEVAQYVNSYNSFNMPFLNKEESWDLLRRKVFAEELCPPKLEKAGKKIAENCEGLPLTIVKIADLLSKAEKTPEYWNKVAADKENSFFMDAYDQILEVLYPSYNYLPQHLKGCFLYMGAFPQSYEVRRSRLINLWSAEGFLESNPYQSFEDFVMQCMKELVSSNLVMACQWSCYSERVKAWNLHSVFWHLCRKEAGSQKSLYILNVYADGFAKDIESQRRLSIYRNILLGVKDVHNSVASISTARSLLCTGAYHRYQVPICFGLRLLKVLDALTIRFYEFPVEVLELVQLRYLALTYNGNLPSSISKLWSLQYFIVYQHVSIKSIIDQSYLPVEIWDLQELKYLQIVGRNLPDPCGVVLPNLLTLLDVGAHCCTKSVFQSIPNLEKLRVQIELAPTVTEPLSYFDHISHLYELKSLQCIVTNPKLRPEVVSSPPPLSISPFHLKKLTLSGFGCPWKSIHNIAELPYLEVLKLQCYAFRGKKWEAKEKGFLKLRYLLIEDTDLVQWTAFEDETFTLLHHVTMKNCYKLREIPNIPSLKEIQLIDCNPSVVTCVKQMVSKNCYLYANSSWDDGRIKS